VSAGARPGTDPVQWDANQWDATGQAAAVRRREVSPLELVDAAIARIERLNPALNAVVGERFDAARAEAVGPLPDGPFRGVPILLKDVGCHLAGEPTHYGTSFLRDADVRWPTDSHLGRLFRAAGFVVLGRTNVPELGSSLTTEPRANGPTRNPWATDRSVGGSSGGSAAAVAAGMVAVAHAGDGGGSIRIPASLCGLVGLKPSRARVSQGPQSGERWAGATVEGVVSRTVRDTAALLDVIGRPMPGDPYSAPPLPRPLAAELGAPLDGLRVGVLDDPPGALHPECRAAVARTADLLADLGCAVTSAAPAGLFDPAFHRHFGRVIAADVALQLATLEREVLGRPVTDDELEPRNVRYRAAGRRMSAVELLGARAGLERWARGIAEWWSPSGGGFDLLVTPTVAGPAPTLGWFTAGDARTEGERIMEFIPCSAQFNATGQPAISLPLGATEDLLPVGVQVVAAAGREDLLVRVAAALERTPAWLACPPPLAG
jgi:amidase